MRLGRSCMLLILTILTQNKPTYGVVPAAAAIFTVTRGVLFNVHKTWQIVGPMITGGQITMEDLRSRQNTILNEMMNVNKEISLVENNLSSSSNNLIGNLRQDLPKVIRMELKLDDLFTKTAKIEAAHNSFQDYLQTGVNKTVGGLHYESHTLEDFATHAVSQSPDSILGLMEHIHFALAPSSWQKPLLVNEGGVLHQIKLALQDSGTYLCNVQQSPQQILYNIYASLQMTQLKGYTMMQFSWMLLRLHNKGNFTLESNKSKDKYLERMKIQVQAAKKATEDATRYMWRCDPQEQVEDETFSQLTNLLQGYLANKVFYNNYKPASKTCSDYSNLKEGSCRNKDTYDTQRKCFGRIVDCKFIDHDITVCHADKRSDNRYNWIKYKNGQIFGDTSKSCSANTHSFYPAKPFEECIWCFCLCDDPFNSDRFFNLRPVTSDIDENKVVTAIRFIKLNRVVHLQIQEGVMLPKGAIDESSIAWKPVELYKVGVTGVQNKDYHEMSWEERAINLDDVHAPPNFVMTGVKFRKIGTHLNIEIRITPFNFNDGLMTKSHAESKWISNENADGTSTSPRTEVKLNTPDVPTRQLTKTHPDSHSNQFVLFSHSDTHKDAAQHTVPFIDTQIVGPQPPMPLSGAGLFHKGLNGYGGYIAPKVFTYDMGFHLQENFEDPQDNF